MDTSIVLYAGETPAGNSLAVISLIENSLQSWSHRTPSKKFVHKPPGNSKVYVSLALLAVSLWL